MPVAVGMACPHHMLTLQRGVPPVNTSASYLRLCSITSLISSTLTWWQSLNMAPLIGRTMVGSGYCLLCQYSGISSLVIRLIRTPRLKAKMTAETGLNKKDICWLSSQEDNYSSLPEERWIDTEWQNTHTHTHTHTHICPLASSAFTAWVTLIFLALLHTTKESVNKTTLFHPPAVYSSSQPKVCLKLFVHITHARHLNYPFHSLAF